VDSNWLRQPKIESKSYHPCFEVLISLAGWDSTGTILIARIKREDTDGWVGIAPIVTLLIKWPGMEA
jgi:hypothetical protein